MKEFFYYIVLFVFSVIALAMCILNPSKANASEKEWEYVDMYQISKTPDMTVGIPVYKLEYEENKIRKKAGKKYQTYIELKPKNKRVLIKMGIY